LPFPFIGRIDMTPGVYGEPRVNVLH